MSDPKPRSGLAGAIIPLVAALALGFGGFYLLFGRAPDRAAELAAPPAGCILNPPANIGGPIALTSHEGRRTTQADFAGAPTVVYFGFTHCPDICPNSMYLLADSLKLLGAQGQSVKTALITVDPERDTPAAMRDYVGTEGFPPGLVGLTGNQDEIAAAARAFAVSYAKSPAGDSYTMSHTSFLYVLDGSWRARAVINTVGKKPDEVAACIREGLKIPGGA
jgi:protein SCO1/2